jgi:hypothetical protein
MRYPRCTLTGRWFNRGQTGVCLASAHPRCRIPALMPNSPSVQTEKGWLRPERSLVYDQSTILLHHAAATRPGVILDAAALAGFSKTSSRLLALMRLYPWAQLSILEFPSPEELLFSTPNNPLLLDLIHLRKQLQQIETLSLHTLNTSTFLAFRRC